MVCLHALSALWRRKRYDEAMNSSCLFSRPRFWPPFASVRFLGCRLGCFLIVCCLLATRRVVLVVIARLALLLQRLGIAGVGQQGRGGPSPQCAARRAAGGGERRGHSCHLSSADFPCGTCSSCVELDLWCSTACITLRLTMHILFIRAAFFNSLSNFAKSVPSISHPHLPS